MALEHKFDIPIPDFLKITLGDIGEEQMMFFRSKLASEKEIRSQAIERARYMSWDYCLENPDKLPYEQLESERRKWQRRYEGLLEGDEAISPAFEWDCAMANVMKQYEIAQKDKETIETSNG